MSPGLVCAVERTTRRDLARERATAARESLADCQLCAHHCGVNRLAGELGLCRAGSAARVFAAQVECGDERELIPTFAVAFSGCDLRCDFCITGAASWNPEAGDGFTPESLASRAITALGRGARTVMFLGGEPTIHLPSVLEFVAAIPASARLVWKTNAHGSVQAREWLDGLFDVWLADYKFGNDACAQRLGRAPGYVQTVRENLRWAAQHSELIVRHLLMPGHLNCCWRPIARWLASELPDTKVSLNAGYWPAWHARRHPELRGVLPVRERQAAETIAAELGLNLIQ